MHCNPDRRVLSSKKVIRRVRPKLQQLFAADQRPQTFFESVMGYDHQQLNLTNLLVMTFAFFPLHKIPLQYIVTSLCLNLSLSYRYISEIVYINSALFNSLHSRCKI